MSLSSDLNKHIYVGNGVTKTFDYEFDILTEDDLHIYLTDTINGTETEITSNYSVSPSEGTFPSSNGTVTYPSIGTAISSDYKLTIIRTLEVLQPTVYPNNTALKPKVVERSFDRITMIAQQQQEQIDRTLQFAITVPDSFSRSLPAPVALKALRINSDATAFEYTTDPEIAADQAAASAAAALVSATNSTNSATSSANSATAAASSAATIGGFLDYTATAKTADIITKSPRVDARSFYVAPQVNPDGTYHPLSEIFATLAEAQAVYSCAEALTDSIDWCVLQTAIDYAIDNLRICYIPAGIYIINKTLQITKHTASARIKAFIKGDAGSPVATYATSGTVIRTTTSGITAMATPRLDPSANNLEYWCQEIIIEDLNFIGTKTYLSTFTTEEQSCIGLDLSFTLYTRVTNVNSNGFGIGIQHENCSEVYHTGLTATTNNYTGVKLKRTSRTDLVYTNDCQVWFNYLQSNYNQRRDLHLDNIRTLYINGGEFVTGYDVLTDYERILIENSPADSSFYFSNFNAENHTSGLPLILAQNCFVGNLSIKNGCFQSFANPNVSPSQNNPLIRLTNCNFNTVKVIDSSFDRNFGAASAYGRNLNSIIIIDVQANISTTMSIGEIICENNSPSWYNTAIADYQEPNILNNVHVPRDYVNILGFDAPITPNFNFSRNTIVGTYSMGTNPFDSSTYEIKWTSTSTNNYAVIKPYLPLKSREVVAVIICDDSLNTVIPRIYALSGIGTEGTDWNACTTKGETYTANGITYQKYIFNIQVQNLAALESSGITAIGVANLYGNAGVTSGIVMLAAYASKKDIVKKNWDRLTPATTAPASGQYMAGETQANSAFSTGGITSWMCVASGSPGTWQPTGHAGFRSNAGTPVSVLTPTFVGEEVLDSTNSKWYKAISLVNTGWVALN